MQNLLSRLRPSTRPLINAEELDQILHMFDKAALLVDKSSQEIVSTNPKLMELTAYTRDELLSMEIGDLLSLDVKGLLAIRKTSEDGTFPRLELTTRHQQKVYVSVQTQPLSETNPWALITLESVTERILKKASDDLVADLLNHQLLALTSATQNSDPEEALEQVLEIGRKLLPESTLGLYVVRGQQPSMRRITTIGEHAEVFPAEIASADVNHLIQPSIWHKGERAITTLLHQSARSAGFSYLASAPIGERGMGPHQKAWLGLVIAGGVTPSPDNTLPLLNILAGFAAAIIHNNVLLTNLRRRLIGYKGQLSIWDAVQENTKDGVITISPDMLIQSLNPEAELILGYASAEIKGLPIDNVIIGTDRLMPALQRSLRGIPTPSLGNTQLHRRDGASFTADLEISPILSDGSIIGGLIFIRDLSENEQIRLRSQQLEQRALLGEVTAIFAHEVRNPINNINMGLQLLERALDEDHPEQTRIQSMLEDSRRLTNLMDSVLTFSRTGNYKFESIDIEQFIEQILKRWRPRFRRVNIQPHLKAPSDLPEILGDHRSLEQVFTNIISNAVNAMQDGGGTFAVKLSEADHPSGKPTVQIDLSDTGLGIPKENQEKIFEPFFTTKPDGTGLGLAISKQIITAHRGNITVSSFPGGTTFQIQLPAVTPLETATS